MGLLLCLFSLAQRNSRNKGGERPTRKPACRAAAPLVLLRSCGASAEVEQVDADVGAPARAARHPQPQRHAHAHALPRSAGSTAALLARPAHGGHAALGSVMGGPAAGHSCCLGPSAASSKLPLAVCTAEVEQWHLGVPIQGGPSHAAAGHLLGQCASGQHRRWGVRLPVRHGRKVPLGSRPWQARGARPNGVDIPCAATAPGDWRGQLLRVLHRRRLLRPRGQPQPRKHALCKADRPCHGSPASGKKLGLREREEPAPQRPKLKSCVQRRQACVHVWLDRGCTCSGLQLYIF